ncbi:hypothetical protein [Flavihumibacter sp.]|uniref:hypothetical protein n=1 Tax=Flavihumibacter sp. TaxID=1913981 RepID=UPI002FC90CDB
MKLASLIVIFYLVESLNADAQITLRLNNYTSNIKNFKDTTIEALKIVSFILSTEEFKESLSKFKFKCTNLHSSRRTECSELLGPQVYDSLNKFSDTTLDIIIKKLPLKESIFDPNDQIGKSSYGKFKVTTRSWYLNQTTKSWYASVKYAAHLAHEYCHIRGYYHINGQKYGEDVAQTVGKIVSKIIMRRLKANEPITHD